MIDFDLPDHPSYTGLMQVLGADRLGQLCLTLAGKRLYIPRTPNPLMIEILGIEAADRLCQAYAGEQIEVPVTVGRIALIHDLRRRNPDLSVGEIARQLRISRRTVTRALAARDPLAGLDRKRGNRQLTLFAE